MSIRQSVKFFLGVKRKYLTLCFFYSMIAKVIETWKRFLNRLCCMIFMVNC